MQVGHKNEKPCCLSSLFPLRLTGCYKHYSRSLFMTSDNVDQGTTLHYHSRRLWPFCFAFIPPTLSYHKLLAYLSKHLPNSRIVLFCL